ncbi:MAG: VWA domain-containing protein [Bacteroidales bacterium]
MFRFGNVEILYALVIIPILILLFLFARYLKRRAMRKYGDITVISQLMPLVSKIRPVIKFIFIIAALTSVIFALADPQFGSKIEKVERKGVEIIIALDVSNSMLAEDIKPSRLERAKRSISKMIDQLNNDKIGFIVFAGDAYIQVPVTTDYSAVKMFLSTVDTDIVPTQGTAIGSAINLAVRSFDSESDLEKALIIISDGEDHEGEAVQAAQRAGEEDVKIHTIGMASSEGGPIPIRESGGQVQYQKDENGNTVISKLDETMLKSLAAEGKGTYVRASNSRTGLSKLYEEIDEMTQKEIESKQYTDYEHRFQYLIGLALFFLFIDFLILERKNKRLTKYNPFKIKE